MEAFFIPAWYGRKVMDWLQLLDTAILPEKQIKQLDPQGTALFNMNHREDYELALKPFAETEPFT